ncbi:MAG TPA: HAD family hydrolase [Acidimicrobiales bacterium]|nr:HAD family hydrolase [Acidimicrobiales bacterium]
MVLVSFDIDGTLSFGDPPGPITLAMVAEAKRRGHVIGSASDRTLREQRRMWEQAGIEVDFVSHKHHLGDTRDRFSCSRLVHIGDTTVDEHYAKLAGFEFFHVDSLPAPSSPGWVY